MALPDAQPHFDDRAFGSDSAGDHLPGPRARQLTKWRLTQPLEAPLQIGRRLAEELIGEFGYTQRFPEEQYAEPHGDPGMFGPDSVTWQVHSDLATVLIATASGGLLTALHPAISAGVRSYDTRFWSKPAVRVSRTLSYIYGATYGSTPVVEKIAGRLERVHGRVEGVTAAGDTFRALDPALITFVHVCETSLFLASYRRYHPGVLTDDQADQYIAEMAALGQLLGGHDLPRSVAEVDTYFETIRGGMGLDVNSQEIFDSVQQTENYTSLVVRQVLPIVMAAGIDLLPDWAQDMYGIPHWRRSLAPVTTRPLAHALVRAVDLLYGPAREYELAAARCS